MCDLNTYTSLVFSPLQHSLVTNTRRHYVNKKKQVRLLGSLELSLYLTFFFFLQFANPDSLVFQWSYAGH